MIRRATADDLDLIARLAAQLGGLHDPGQLPARLRRILDQATQAVFIAEGDHGPCGFAAAEHHVALQAGEYVELAALLVDEDARRHGFGAQLVAATEAWAMRRGVDRVLVRADATGDEAAHAFYPALGYAPLETRHVYAKAMR